MLKYVCVKVFLNCFHKYNYKHTCNFLDCVLEDMRVIDVAC